MAEQGSKPKRSPFIRIGLVLMGVGMFLPGAVERIAQSLEGGFLKATLLISTDLLRLCFFIGVAVLLIGLVRKRKQA